MNQKTGEYTGGTEAPHPGGELAGDSSIFNDFCLKYFPACAADPTPSGLD